MTEINNMPSKDNTKIYNNIDSILSKIKTLSDTLENRNNHIWTKLITSETQQQTIPLIDTRI